MTRSSKIYGATLAVTVGAATGCAAVVQAQDQPPFGQPEDVQYAQQLWDKMAEVNYVGDDAFLTYAYQGTEPHGAVLTYLENTAFTMDGHTGLLIVKKNFVGEDISPDAVMSNPDQWLESVTVMYQRAEGYDPETNNWFWAKYAPDGSLSTNQQGMELAGKVAKGAAEGGAHGGCIGCHQEAQGNDYIYTYDR